MKSQHYLDRRSWGIISLILALGWGTACDQGARSLALDKPKAHQSLVEFLDCWKSGKPPADFVSTHAQSASRDPDWDAGKTLVNYTIGAESDDGTNLHSTVDLVLRDSSGTESQEQVVYIVGTSPVLSIFRQ